MCCRPSQCAVVSPHLHFAERLRLVSSSGVGEPHGELALHTDEIDEGHIRHVDVLSGPAGSGQQRREERSSSDSTMIHSIIAFPARSRERECPWSSESERAQQSNGRARRRRATERTEQASATSAAGRGRQHEAAGGAARSITHTTCTDDGQRASRCVPQLLCCACACVRASDHLPNTLTSVAY